MLLSRTTQQKKIAAMAAMAQSLQGQQIATPQRHSLLVKRIAFRVDARFRDTEKEKSRRFRRTTFGHDEWANHRSTSRYWRHLKSGLFASRIVRGLAAPLIYVGAISFVVAVYEEALVNGMLHDIGSWQWPSLSMSMSGPFSLSTFALSLLLVFRTNSSYQRWNEARRLWGLCTNRSRDIARQALLWMSADSDAALLAAMLRWTAAFPLALMVSLRADHQLKETLQGVLLPAELELLAAQSHPGTACLQAMGACVAASHATPIQKMRIDENITTMQDVMGGCERIFKTPIPLSYTRHTSRFLVCWLTLLPFCVADAFGWATIPISIGLAFFLFGIEEIGVQIEEPFGILALEVLCESIQNNIKQAEALSAPLQTATAAAAAQPAAADVDGLAQEFLSKLLAAAGSHTAGSSNSSSSAYQHQPAAGASYPLGKDYLTHSSILAAALQVQQAAGVQLHTEFHTGKKQPQCEVLGEHSEPELYLGSSVGGVQSDDEGYNF